MVGMLVSPSIPCPPDSYAEILMLSVMVLGHRTLGRCRDYKVVPSWKG